MKNKKSKSRPDASAPGNPSIQLPPELFMYAVMVRALIAAGPEDDYDSGRTPPLTSFALNWNNLLAHFGSDVAVSTKKDFDAGCRRIVREIEATHHAIIFPLQGGTEMCTEHDEVLVLICRSKHDQLIWCKPVLRDGKGHFVGFGETLTTADLQVGELLIEQYFNENAAKAPAGHTWNYIPGNN